MRKLLKASLSCLALLFFISSPLTGRTKLLAGEVLTEQKIAEPKLNATEITMVTGSVFNLKVYNLTEKENRRVRFKSDDSGIVSVSRTGRLVAGKVGETVINVTLKGAKPHEDTVYKCKVTVGPPAISIKLTLSELTIEVGKKKTLQAILKPNTTAETAVFLSDDSEIVSVSATGRLEARKIGTTTVYSQIENGKYDLCVVKVVESGKAQTE